MPLQGGCHCGAIRYEVDGDPGRCSLCHCADCRRAAGAPAVAWAIYPRTAVRVTKGAPKIYASSENGRRHFCPDCGTGLFYGNDAVFEGMIDLQTATLDDPDAVEPVEQIQVADRIAWVARLHELPTHDRWPPQTD